MDEIRFLCKGCEQAFRTSASKIGTRFHCPNCEDRSIVPDQDGALTVDVRAVAMDAELVEEPSEKQRRRKKSLETKEEKAWRSVSVGLGTIYFGCWVCMAGMGLVLLVLVGSMLAGTSGTETEVEWMTVRGTLFGYGVILVQQLIMLIGVITCTSVPKTSSGSKWIDHVSMLSLFALLGNLAIFYLAYTALTGDPAWDGFWLTLGVEVLDLIRWIVLLGFLGAVAGSLGNKGLKGNAELLMWMRALLIILGGLAIVILQLNAEEGSEPEAVPMVALIVAVLASLQYVWLMTVVHRARRTVLQEG